MPEKTDALAKAFGRDLVKKDDLPGLREYTDKLKQKVYADSLETLDAASGAFDIEPEQDVVPPEWVEMYGDREARRRHRIALAAQKSNKEAPYALKMAVANVTAHQKATAISEQAKIGTLSVNFINVQAPEFPRQKLDDNDE